MTRALFAATSTESEVLAAVQHSLGTSEKDLPFALVYLFENDGTRARLAASTGISPGHAAAPETPGVKKPWAVKLSVKRFWACIFNVTDS